MPEKPLQHADRFEKGGYRPLQEGYTPDGQRGYVPIGSGDGLPKAPPGGTGESGVASNQTPA